MKQNKSLLFELYQRKIADNLIHYDSRQSVLINKLDIIRNNILVRKAAASIKQPFIFNWKKLSSRLLSFSSAGKPESVNDANATNNVYLFGNVGCGKTFLMDLLLESFIGTPILTKRFHFNAFMNEIHSESHRIKMEHKYSIDPLPIILKNIVTSTDVLLLDEFQVTDIADAMVLSSLIPPLLKNNDGGLLSFVTTSNRNPRELYKNGIQRDNFIPCIDSIENDCLVVDMDSDKDYRMILVSNANNHRSVTTQEAYELFQEMTHFSATETKLNILGHNLTVTKAYKNIAWFTFDELCRKNFGSLDYLHLVKHFNVFFIVGINSINNVDEARRFINLVDILYDCKQVKAMFQLNVPLNQLFILTQKKPTNDEEFQKELSLYHDKEQAFACKRTISRLFQMQQEIFK